MSLFGKEKNGFEIGLNLNFNEENINSNGLFTFQNKMEFENDVKNIIYNNNEEENNNIESFYFVNKVDIPLPLPENNPEIKEKNITDMSMKSTEIKSSIISLNRCIFETKSGKRIEQRVDYAIKNIKVHFMNFIKNEMNHIIILCFLPKQLKISKLFSPSYKYFTGNSNEKNNKFFLDFTVEKIFIYPEGKTEKNDNRLQRRNKEIIQTLKTYINNIYLKEKRIPEHYQKLLNYFNMTFEDVIINFYESNQFKEYISSPKAKFLDEHFIKVKGFSLLEKNSFFKWLKIIK